MELTIRNKWTTECHKMILHANVFDFFAIEISQLIRFELWIIW